MGSLRNEEEVKESTDSQIPRMPPTALWFQGIVRKIQVRAEAPGCQEERACHALHVPFNLTVSSV